MWGFKEVYNLIKVLLWTTLRFLKGYSFKLKEVPQTVRLDGKVAIVTGANTGIGYETALDFAKRGATVILACRDDTKGKTAVDKIKTATKNDKVEYIQLDLNSLTSVRQFASDFRKKNLPLHILVNNAGIMNLPKRTETADGFEAQFGVNHLGHFLLTNLLLDIIKSSAPARIVNLSSAMHFGGEIRFDDIHYKKSYNLVQSYSNSKVANVLFTYELAKRLEGTGVVVNAIHPGSVDTELTRYNEFPMLNTVKKMMFRTPYEGALTQIWVAVAPEAEKITGKFWSDCLVADSCALSYDEKTQKKLWDVSAQLVNLK